ncbi:MAG: hypothetical protein JWR86_3126, partial [Enterovirga sp.]|nr:hypothetical protein [Enterovirga sp.]
MTQTAARRLLQRPLDAAPQETKFLPSPPRLA